LDLDYSGGRGSATGRSLSTNRTTFLIPVPYKIIQTPGLIAMLFEADNTHRQVFTDGRKPLVDPQRTWLGYSNGKWEGDTVVVDTIELNDKNLLDARDFGHMESSSTKY